MNLDEEVRLYTTNAERERTENLATLYSIIVSLEYLERAYVRDSVVGKEYRRSLSQPERYLMRFRYAPACIKLLAQYKSLMKLVGDDIGGVEPFMRRFKVSHPSIITKHLILMTFVDGPPGGTPSFECRGTSDGRAFGRSCRWRC